MGEPARKGKIRNRKRVGNQRDRGAEKTTEAGEVTRGFFVSLRHLKFSLEINIRCLAISSSKDILAEVETEVKPANRKAVDKLFIRSSELNIRIVLSLGERSSSR